MPCGNCQCARAGDVVAVQLNRGGNPFGCMNLNVAGAVGEGVAAVGEPDDVTRAGQSAGTQRECFDVDQVSDAVQIVNNMACPRIDQDMHPAVESGADVDVDRRSGEDRPQRRRGPAAAVEPLYIGVRSIVPRDPEIAVRQGRDINFADGIGRAKGNGGQRRAVCIDYPRQDRIVGSVAVGIDNHALAVIQSGRLRRN